MRIQKMTLCNVVAVIASAWLTIGFAIAQITPRAAPPVDRSIHCQREADGRCVCGPRGRTGRNIPCIPDERTTPPQADAAQCVYSIDPRLIDDMLRAKPGVCQRYGPDQIICQNTTAQQCDAPPQAGTPQRPLQGNLQEDRVAWANWCEEYKRLLKAHVWTPLDAQYGSGPYQYGDRQWYRLQFDTNFYNPRFWTVTTDGNGSVKLTNNLGATMTYSAFQKDRQGRTIRRPPVLNSSAGMIFVSPAFAYQVQNAGMAEAFAGAAQISLESLAAAVPPFPPESNVSSFSRPTANVRLVTRSTGRNVEQYWQDCERFVEQFERPPPANANPQRRRGP